MLKVEAEKGNTFGRKLAALRKARGLSQEKLAEEIFATRQTISRWEVDAVIPSSENLRMLSKALAVTTDQLLDDKLTAQDILRQMEEAQEKPAQEPLPGKKGKTSILLMGILAGLLAAVILTGVVFAVKRIREGEITPIEDLEIGETKNYPTETFHFEPVG